MITDERLKELMASVGMPESKSLYSALKQCDMEAELRMKAENEKLIAEREQWMKQEPYGYVNPEDEWSLRNKGYAQIQPKLTDYSTLPLFLHPLPAQQVPEGCAESEFEKYFEKIGVDAWEDHPVSQAYIDGFNRAIELSAAPKPEDE